MIQLVLKENVYLVHTIIGRPQFHAQFDFCILHTFILYGVVTLLSTKWLFWRKRQRRYLDGRTIPLDLHNKCRGHRRLQYCHHIGRSGTIKSVFSEQVSAGGLNLNRLTFYPLNVYPITDNVLDLSYQLREMVRNQWAPPTTLLNNVSINDLDSSPPF